MMNIKIGEIYVNKTWRFLLPCLKGHGDNFVRKFNPVFKLGMGISDHYLKDTDYCKEKNVFIMIDKAYHEKLSEDFITWLSYQPYYKHDYSIGSRKHMIIISIPSIFENAYEQFLLGNYSKMYTLEEIALLFSTKDRKTEYDIITKNILIEEDFIKRVNTEFGTSVSSFNEPIKEYEFPLNMEEEVFNYQQSEYSERELHKI